MDHARILNGLFLSGVLLLCGCAPLASPEEKFIEFVAEESCLFGMNRGFILGEEKNSIPNFAQKIQEIAQKYGYSSADEAFDTSEVDTASPEFISQVSEKVMRLCGEKGFWGASYFGIALP